MEAALEKYAIVEHEKYGKIYVFEVDDFGNRLMMDDIAVPSLLTLPYLDGMDVSDPIYQNTKKFVLSSDNPFIFEGKAAKGIGGPHVGMDMIWPFAITMQGLTSTDSEEIRSCIKTLKNALGGTGFMHENFHKDDASDFI